MACNRNRADRVATVNVITDRRQCCGAAETTGQEMYSGTSAAVLVESCQEPDGRIVEIDARYRCRFWPHFAHPRWLSCRALHNLTR